MRQAVVICTTPDSSPFLPDLTDSLSGCEYPIEVVSNYGYELGKIKYVMDNTNYDEFVLLHETCLIKDLGMFRSIFEDMAGKSVSLCVSPPPVGSYLGKYRREILEKMVIPEIKSKLDSVNYEEIFNREYPDKWYYLDPPLHNSDVFIEKHGKKVMVLENKYLIKYKSIWSRSQL